MTDPKRIKDTVEFIGSLEALIRSTADIPDDGSYRCPACSASEQLTDWERTENGRICKACGHTVRRS